MQLAELLQQQHQTLTAMLRLLDSEKQAIASRQSADIERIAKEKLSLLNQIQQIDAQIARHPDKDSLKTDAPFIDTVAALQSLLQQCHNANEVNGAALQRAQLSFHKLNNLFLQSRGRQQMGYNAEGKATNVRSLGTNIKA
uniref:flagella synthesis protein FlgN n=1 Tax=Thaumasiovibrio occultus TaxID=1891184 RepID=UPI001865361B|nr:flagellar export chaperone FlgN [Thaumasiovibrio occultus]